MSMTRILLMVREIRKQYQRQPSITKQSFSTNESSTDIGEANDIHLRSVEAIACIRYFKQKSIDVSQTNASQ